MYNESNPVEVRFLAAREAAPYVHAKLSSVEATHKIGKTHEERLQELQALVAEPSPVPKLTAMPDASAGDPPKTGEPAQENAGSPVTETWPSSLRH